MRRRHKQGNFWLSVSFYACPDYVCCFPVLSRDSVLVVTNCGLSSRELKFQLVTRCRFHFFSFSVKIWIKDRKKRLYHCSFNFLGALSTNGMRSMWEFVFVSQFLRVFQGKFGFVCFTAEVRIKTTVCCKQNIYF